MTTDQLERRIQMAIEWCEMMEDLNLKIDGLDKWLHGHKTMCHAVMDTIEGQPNIHTKEHIDDFLKSYLDKFRIKEEKP